jgi:hypothetical protein
MYDTVVDRIARWLAQFSAEAQLAIMAAAFALLWGCLLWVTL